MKIKCLTLFILPLLCIGEATSHVKQHFNIEHPAQFLPPALTWQGLSEQLIEQRKQYQTPIEQNNFSATPSYQQTMDYLTQLAQKSALIKISYFAKSPQGRDIALVHVSSDFSKTDRAKLLVQAGIHSGEIDGKDAGIMLLRDIVSGKKRGLIDNVDMLFVPIFNVDGHENSSLYHRVNQRGPSNMGWRTTAQNINLNRDYAKASSVEMRGMLALINQYQPSLYLDLHVTDGADYQYDITYGVNGSHSYSPAIASWFSKFYRPQLDKDLLNNGHIPGRLVFAKNGKDIKQGIAGWTATQRYSDGYGATRHLPTVLVENHSLNPYKQRVFGTYILIESSLKLLANHGDALSRAIKTDKASRPSKLALSWGYNSATYREFKGISYQTFEDEISGTTQVKWLGKPELIKAMPWFEQNVAQKITKLPAAYWIMPEQTNAIATLMRHCIKVEVLSQPKNLKLEKLSAYDESFGKRPYEGIMRVSAKFKAQSTLINLPKGAVRITTDQDLGILAFTLLEPQSSDSLFQWGFFNTMFQRTEYIEGYAVVPLAHEMLAQSPTLRAQFEKKLASDSDFSANPRARLAWFYQRSPFYDKQVNVYPVYRQW